MLCNEYCFSTVTLVARKCLGVTLYVQRLSYFHSFVEKLSDVTAHVLQIIKLRNS